MKENYTSLNDILTELKLHLNPVQHNLEKEYTNNKYPLGFIIGNPRSGTTLLLQYLASLKCFSYPTNFLARFSYAPHIGALAQQMVFNNEFDPLGEFESSNNKILFNSFLGKSKGALAPNEFQHFFRNYTNTYFPEYLPNNKVSKIDFNSIFKGLISIESVFNKPFVTKALMFQYNLIPFFEAIPNSIFLHIKREPIFIMQSIYLARLEYYNNINEWWSVKPKEYTTLKEMDIYNQIAGQVYYTNLHIEQQLNKIPEDNKFVIYYEDFCSNPSKITSLLKEKYKKLGYYLSIEDNDITLKESNTLKISEAEIKKLKKAYSNFNQ